MNELNNFLSPDKVFNCALLSADVYLHREAEKDPQLCFWERLCEVGDVGLGSKWSSGFFARLYGNPHWGESIIAYRGTVGAINLNANAHIAINEWGSYDDNAIAFLDEAQKWMAAATKENSQFYNQFPLLTGHSLGGYLAQVAADYEWGLKAIIFDAPGIAGLYNPNTRQHVHRHNPHVYNITTYADPVHGRGGNQVGHVYGIAGTNECTSAVDSFHETGRTAHYPSFQTGNPDVYHAAAQMAVYTSCAVMVEHSIQTLLTQLQNNPDVVSAINKDIAM